LSVSDAIRITFAQNALPVPFLSDTHLRDLTILFHCGKKIDISFKPYTTRVCRESRGRIVWRDRIFISLQKYDRPPTLALLPVAVPNIRTISIFLLLIFVAKILSSVDIL
jgi:hypothetical protein